MYYTHTGRVIAPQDIRECVRIIREVDEERRELAAFAARRTSALSGLDAELDRHKDRLHDLAEQEERMMIRTRYVELEPHWRAHRRFQRFLSAADTREELLFCTDWLRQHEAADDTEFRQWLRHGCAPDDPDCCLDILSLYRTDPERILLTTKLQMASWNLP